MYSTKLLNPEFYKGCEFENIYIYVNVENMKYFGGLLKFIFDFLF